MKNHNKTYSMALVGLAGFAAISFGLLVFLAEVSAGQVAETLLPGWSLPWVALMNLGYTIAIVVTLCVRRFRPEAGRVLTRALNWALLPALPAGTVVGLYGLLKVDRKSQ